MCYSVLHFVRYVLSWGLHWASGAEEDDHELPGWSVQEKRLQGDPLTDYIKCLEMALQLMFENGHNGFR